MNTQKAAASTIVKTMSLGDPATVMAVANATSNHAVTSSIAAAASTTPPIGRLIIRRSTRIRARTGNAVIDIEIPMKRANEANLVSGAITS